MRITADHTSLDVYGAAAVDGTIIQAEYLRGNPVDQTPSALNNTGSRIVLEVNSTQLIRSFVLRIVMFTFKTPL